jgi:TolA-binding protein
LGGGSGIGGQLASSRRGLESIHAVFQACVFEVGPEHCTLYMESNVGQLPFTHKALAWFEANMKQALWTTGIVLVVGVIIAFFLYQKDETEKAASEMLSNIAVTPATGAGSRTDSAEAYLKVVSTYPKSRAAARALLLAAGSLFVDGKYADAKTQFERFRRDYSSSPLLGEAVLGVAASLEAQGQTREAMTAYKELVDRYPSDSNVPQAKFALGRLSETQNEPEKARNYFEEVERADPFGSLGDEAKMRLEDLKTKYPKLFETVAPPPAVALPFTNAAPVPKAASPTNPATPGIAAPPSNAPPPKVEKP